MVDPIGVLDMVGDIVAAMDTVVRLDTMVLFVFVPLATALAVGMAASEPRVGMGLRVVMEGAEVGLTGSGRLISITKPVVRLLLFSASQITADRQKERQTDTDTQTDRTTCRQTDGDRQTSEVPSILK